MYMSVNLIAFFQCCNEDKDVLSKQSNKYCISLELCDGPRVQFLMPLSFPQEFLNWICTCSLSLRRWSIRFLDDWWTRFIGSQLLYSQKDNWITLWGNWLLCYGMHHGKLSNLPGALKNLLQTEIGYHVALMKSLMTVVVITGNDFLSSLPVVIV